MNLSLRGLVIGFVLAVGLFAQASASEQRVALVIDLPGLFRETV